MCNPVTTFGGRRASSGTQPTMAAANNRLDCFLIFDLIRFPSFFSPSPAQIHSECGPTRPSHVVNPNLHRPPAAKHLCQGASSSGQRPTKPIPAAVWRSLLSSNNRCCNCPHAAESRKPTIFKIFYPSCPNQFEVAWNVSRGYGLPPENFLFHRHGGHIAVYEKQRDMPYVIMHG